MKSKESAENTIRFRKHEKIYSGIDQIPRKTADNTLTPGCLVLEGGGWKGLYTLGVRDALMEYGLNFSSVAGVSAGALSGLGYVAGEIGWGARIDLTYRHDRNYCGIGAFRRDHGITGFSYLFDDLFKVMPFDGDMEKLGSLYWLGYRDMSRQTEDLIAYLQA